MWTHVVVAGVVAVLLSGEEQHPITSHCNPLPVSTRLIVYNRTPKCGSTTMVKSIKAAAKVNRVNVITSEEYWFGERKLQNVLTSILLETAGAGSRSVSADAMPLATLLQENGTVLQEGGGGWTKSVYHTHVLWPNLTAVGMPSNAYTFFQLMRDPVDRFVSWHYYRLYGPRPAAALAANRERVMAMVGMNHPPDVDEFVASQYRNKSGCQNGLDHNMQTRQFCGFHPDCEKVCSSKALKRAKRNLDAEYFLVGTLEELNRTVELMELLAPTFFRGLTSAVRKSKPQRVGASNVSHGTELTRGRLRVFNSQDEYLYRYASRQIRDQYSKCVGGGL